AAFDVEEDLHLAGVGPRGNISLGADDRRLAVRLLDIAEQHIEHTHGAFEQHFVPVALVERIAAGRHDDYAQPAVDEARHNEVRQRQTLLVLFYTGTAADLPDIAMPFDDDEVVRSLGRGGFTTAHTGKQRESPAAG